MLSTNKSGAGLLLFFMHKKFRLLAIIAYITNAVYIIWLVLQVHSVLGWAFFVLELAFSSMVWLFVVNHWKQKIDEPIFQEDYQPAVDIFIPIVTEPIEILEATARAAREIDYENKTVYILDDRNRQEVRTCALDFGFKYLARTNTQEKAFKAANLNFGLTHSQGEIILVLDVDQVAKKNILKDLIGHFTDPSVAVVSTRQTFDVPQDDFNHDHLFYDYMQPGKNADNAAISTGSGVLYRRTALMDIGGFQEWSIVEDLYTTYQLHTKGYASKYIHESYTLGDAPQDLKAIYKQRGVWGFDSLRFLIWKMPFLNNKLTFRQRLHYCELAYLYLVSALVIPLIYILNYTSLITNIPVITDGYIYLAVKIPTLLITFYMYDKLGQGKATSRMWSALSPVYFKSLIRAFIYYKPVCKVTTKRTQQTNRWYLTIPHIILIVAGIVAVTYNIYRYGVSSAVLVNALWLVVMFYWISLVFPKAMASGQSQEKGSEKNPSTVVLKSTEPT